MIIRARKATSIPLHPPLVVSTVMRNGLDSSMSKRARLHTFMILQRSSKVNGHLRCSVRIVTVRLPKVSQYHQSLLINNYNRALKIRWPWKILLSSAETL